MATTSTVPTVKAQLVTVFTTALAAAARGGGQVPVDYAWPGPDTEPEAVFLGRHPALSDIRMDVVDDIPTIKAGRKQRSEEYSVPVTVWEFRPDLQPTDAQECESEAYVLFGLLEDVLAEDPNIGLPSGTILWARLGDHSSTLWPFEKGWACELTFEVDVEARLK